MKKTKKTWKDYLWIASALYLVLGFFNILFAWLGIICFITPLVMTLKTGNKPYCHKYCGRGQLLELLGSRFSRNKPMPRWMTTKAFRYGFLIFFMTMFANMLFVTYLVFSEAASLTQAITLFWTFKLPWNLADLTNVTPWVSQFAFGFYSMMLTSTLLGVITMLLYKPRSWCVYCPMGSMTAGICQLKNRSDS